MNPILLRHAQAMAALMMKRLEGRVARVEVAGSVRRATSDMVNNIDLVLSPKADPQRPGHTIPFMGRGTMVRLVNGLGSPERAIQFAGLVFKPVPVESTDRFFVLETVYNQEDQTPEGIRVNLAVATEDNFGSVLMYRTGKRAFNIYLANRAQTRGLFWSPFANSTSGEVPDGLFDPSTKAVMASRTEEDIFKALKLPFVEPKDRERK